MLSEGENVIYEAADLFIQRDADGVIHVCGLNPAELIAQYQYKFNDHSYIQRRGLGRWGGGPEGLLWLSATFAQSDLRNIVVPNVMEFIKSLASLLRVPREEASKLFDALNSGFHGLDGHKIPEKFTWARDLGQQLARTDQSSIALEV